MQFIFLEDYRGAGNGESKTENQPEWSEQADAFFQFLRPAPYSLSLVTTLHRS